ncbi:MAG: AAA family ATPase [Actinobacteria bacterium]|nr:AAA family ATPase [Actinomycetota bacterium]
MELRLLGPLEVVVDGHTVALPGGRIRSLLALLALHARQILPADRLIDELWGGDPPPTASTALQNLVSRLRKLLEPCRGRDDPPTVLVTHAPGYVLAVDHERIDVHRFRRLVEGALDAPAPERAEQLSAALDLWRGPALADFTYEPFAQTPIAALDELRVTALETRIGADLELDRHVEVVAELEELVAAHPLREDLRAHLMVALYRCGRQAEALDGYRTARRQLVDELGMEPGTRLRALEQAVLAQDPNLNAPGSARVADSVVGARPDTDRAWLGTGRRTVTVWFADLSPVATLTSPDADPEAIRPLMHSAHAAARGVVEQHGGRVEGIVGDVAVAVFGLPVAHEDDPLRAVRAAAALQRELKDLAPSSARDCGTGPAVRVGIATGEIVVGDPTAAGVSGPTAGRASRLQQAAREGEVLLADTTRRLVDRAAILEPVDGPSDATADGRVWRLVEPVAAPTSSPPTDTSLVGRTDELARLREALEHTVRRERAALVTVVGEAGVGKSRLARAFADSVTGEARPATGHCRGYGTGITFWPLRELVQDLTDRTGLAGLERLLAAEPHGAAHARLIGAATSLTDEPLRDPGDLFVAVRRLLEVTARREPLAVLVEDVHWAQPTFLDLVEYLAESIRAPVLLLCLARPELADVRPRWMTEVPSGTTIELQPLGSADSRRLVVERLGGHHLAPEAMGHIQAMGQGNPLFLEQLLAAAREEPGSGRTGRELEVPPTVQALLTARLDRLGPAERDLLRCASVIGVDVELDTLQALVPDEARVHLDRHLQVLEDKQLVRRRSSRQGGVGFDFRHVMIQQAAYRSLTHAVRAELHASLAKWVETESGVAVAEAEELAGLHLEQAVHHRRDLGRDDPATEDLAVRAGERLAGAGLRAYARFDVPAAENLLSRARALLPADHPQRLAVLRRLTEAYPVMGRPDEAADCFEELLDLVERDGDEATSRGVRLEQVRFRMITGPDPIPMSAIQQQVQEALAAFEREGDDVRVSQAHYLLGTIHLRAGRIEELAEVAWRGIERARRTDDLRERLGAPWWVVFHLLHGPTPVPECIRACDEVMDVGGLNHLGVVAALGRFRAMTGEVDEGRRLVVRARELLRERIRLPRPLSFIGQQRAGVELLAGDRAAAVAALEEALEVARQVTARDEAAQIASGLSLLKSRSGHAEAAARLATFASEQAPAEGVIAQALARAAEGRALADHHDHTGAERLVRQAITGVPDRLLPLRALLHETLAEILELAGDEAGTDVAREEAATLHARKGNLVAAQLVTR